MRNLITWVAGILFALGCALPAAAVTVAPSAFQVAWGAASGPVADYKLEILKDATVSTFEITTATDFIVAPTAIGEQYAIRVRAREFVVIDCTGVGEPHADCVDANDTVDQYLEGPWSDWSSVIHIVDMNEQPPPPLEPSPEPGSPPTPFTVTQCDPALDANGDPILDANGDPTWTCP